MRLHLSVVLASLQLRFAASLQAVILCSGGTLRWSFFEWGLKFSLMGFSGKNTSDAFFSYFLAGVSNFHVMGFPLSLSCPIPVLAFVQRIFIYIYMYLYGKPPLNRLRCRPPPTW